MTERVFLAFVGPQIHLPRTWMSSQGLKGLLLGLLLASEQCIPKLMNNSTCIPALVSKQLYIES